MLILQDKHPARFKLQRYTNIINPAEALKAEIRALRLGVLNLMPVMDETEKDILRCISHSVLQIEPVWIRIATREKKGKNTPLAHIYNFYQTMEQATEKQNLDGLIITGAPMEMIHFEEVDYWDELKQIMEYARKNIYCTMHLCWTAMAGAYYFYGIGKVIYPQKLVGIFLMTNKQQDANPFTRGMNPTVHICQSRHADIDQRLLQKLIKSGEIVSLFQSNEKPIALNGEKIGITVFASKDNSLIFNTGHFEYHEKTIDQEVQRDFKKSPAVIYPVVNYYNNPKEKKGLPQMIWKSDSTLFYGNFLHVIYDRMNKIIKKHKPFELQ